MTSMTNRSWAGISETEQVMCGLLLTRERWRGGYFDRTRIYFFSSWRISWNYNQIIHIPFATFLPLS